MVGWNTAWITDCCSIIKMGVTLLKWDSCGWSNDAIISIGGSGGTSLYSHVPASEHLQIHAADPAITRLPVSSRLQHSSQGIKDTSWDPEEDFEKDEYKERKSTPLHNSLLFSPLLSQDDLMQVQLAYQWGAPACLTERLVSCWINE